ncbi:hypothetical protein XpiCFBP4643_07470 [Xanthomonas pisi]|uniref:Transposase n=1 Tax=Xanthomonas pisi TaxID=56457 RepID=A0A2S7D4T5_9XANT|nr:hypothetical protein XpiCFBP4643_07470 [Xanthomonas pisi]
MTRNQAIKKPHFTEAQIAYVLKQAELEMAVGEICRKLGIAEATFYVWRKKYGWLGPSELKRLQLPEVPAQERELRGLRGSLRSACNTARGHQSWRRSTCIRRWQWVVQKYAVEPA